MGTTDDLSRVVGLPGTMPGDGVAAEHRRIGNISAGVSSALTACDIGVTPSRVFPISSMSHLHVDELGSTSASCWTSRGRWHAGLELQLIRCSRSVPCTHLVSEQG